MRNRVLLSSFLLVLFFNVAVAQNAPGPQPNIFKTMDFSIGVVGYFAETRDPVNASSGVTSSTNQHALSETPAPGVVAGFHQQWSRFLGYRVDLGYTRTDFNYFFEHVSTPFALNDLNNGTIRSDIYEGSASYELQGPRTRRLSTFASVGAAILSFVPTDKSQPDSYVFRPAGVGGLGVDFHLTPKLELRSQYRGLFFQSPDFRYHDGPIPVVVRHEYSSEIVLGLAYRFGKR